MLLESFLIPYISLLSHFILYRVYLRLILDQSERILPPQNMDVDFFKIILHYTEKNVLTALR